MRLGIYADLLYHRDGHTVSTDRAFIRFATSLAESTDEVTIFGRLHPDRGCAPYELPSEGVRFVDLPYYPRVSAIGRLLSAVYRSSRIFVRELENVDAVWIFGPHPLAVVFAALARARRKTLFLGVRQDYPLYIENRLPSPRWRWAVPVATMLERLFRRIARKVPTVVLGDELARNYAAGPAPVLITGFSLIRSSDLLAPANAERRSWGETLQLFTVSRLDPEKNPCLLVDVIAGLRGRDPRWRLVVAGEGPLETAVRQRAADLGVVDGIELLGYVPNGPELWKWYRRSHAFLHVSYTEGLPQVLFEAQAAGLPVVATNVGGVAAALGSSGIVVPPGNADAAVDALLQIASDPELRHRLIVAGLENAARETLEAQRERVLTFFRTYGKFQPASDRPSSDALASSSDVT
jgi:glycosyltransferase involved in cell wall biosynthesis